MFMNYQIRMDGKRDLSVSLFQTLNTFLDSVISTHFDQFKCETVCLERRVLINSYSYNSMETETGVMNILIPVRKMPCPPLFLTGGILK